MIKMAKLIDLTGRKFDKLTVLEKHPLVRVTHIGSVNVNVAIS